MSPVSSVGSLNTGDSISDPSVAISASKGCMDPIESSPLRESRASTYDLVDSVSISQANLPMAVSIGGVVTAKATAAK
jgi:hypothetical protein